MKNNRSKALFAQEELSYFCYQLSLMVQAGIGSADGVGLIRDEVEDETKKQALEQVFSALQEGQPLEAALEAAAVFPPYMVKMVGIGESSGRLDEVLAALAEYYRREAETRRAMRRVVAYPAVMAVLIALVFLTLVSQVLPAFERVFDQLGLALSPAAALLLEFGAASRAVTTVTAVLLVLAAAVVLYLFRAGGDGEAISRLIARSSAGQAVDQSRFTAAMALMLSSGLPIDEAVERTAALLEGSPLYARLCACQQSMLEGAMFAQAVEQTGLLTGMQAGLLRSGSKAGVTDQVMRDLSERCGREAEERLDRLMARFEYTLVIVLCCAIGLVMLSVMLPLLGVLSSIGG